MEFISPASFKGFNASRFAGPFRRALECTSRLHFALGFLQMGDIWRRLFAECIKGCPRRGKGLRWILNRIQTQTQNLETQSPWQYGVILRDRQNLTLGKTAYAVLWRPFLKFQAPVMVSHFEGPIFERAVWHYLCCNLSCCGVATEGYRSGAYCTMELLSPWKCIPNTCMIPCKYVSSRMTWSWHVLTNY